MFYVLKFELLFSLDPQTVGRWTFIILVLTITVPNAVMGTIYTYRGQHADKAMAFFTHEDIKPLSFSFVSRQTIFWTSVFAMSSLVAFVFIPIFFKIRQGSADNTLQPQRTISLQRYLLGRVQQF
jgi:hypothetical protein